MEDQLPIIISGPYGRMGQALCRLVKGDPALELAGGLLSSKSNAPASREGSISVRTRASLSDLLGETSPSRAVLIDFTTPAATIMRLQEAAKLGLPVVIGTTGFSDEQKNEISDTARNIPIVLSANMSLGVNVLLSIVEDLARRIGEYDIEVIETHHRLKKDAPSGTALAFAEAAAVGRELNFKDAARHGRHGLTGERSQAEIGIHAIRGGDVVGDHTVLYAGTGERIEITHKASGREAFAVGALTAAKWVISKPAGLYSMQDVLAL